MDVRVASRPCFGMGEEIGRRLANPCPAGTPRLGQDEEARASNEKVAEWGSGARILFLLLAYSRLESELAGFPTGLDCRGLTRFLAGYSSTARLSSRFGPGHPGFRSRDLPAMGLLANSTEGLAHFLEPQLASLLAGRPRLPSVARDVAQ